MRSRSMQMLAGGNAFNAAAAFAHDGEHQVYLVSCCGDDALSEIISSEMKRCHVLDTLMQREVATTSPFSYVMVTKGKRTIVHSASPALSLNVADARTALDLSGISFESFALVYCDGRYAREVTTLLRESWSSTAPGTGPTVCVEAERNREGLAELVAEADILCCSAHYVDLELANSRWINAFSFLECLTAWKLKCLVVTAGENGAFLLFRCNAEVTHNDIQPNEFEHASLSYLDGSAVSPILRRAYYSRKWSSLLPLWTSHPHLTDTVHIHENSPSDLIILHMPALSSPDDVLDPTGCGDTFFAVVSLQLMRGATLYEAMHLAARRARDIGRVFGGQL